MQQREKRRIKVVTVNEYQDGTDAKNVHARHTGAHCTYRLTVGEYYGLLPVSLWNSVKIRSQDMRCVQFEVTHSKYYKSMMTPTILK